MVYSMTGYATIQRYYDRVSVSVELKSTNHRHLTILLKLPDELRFLEASIHSLLNQHIGRGRVECRLELNNQGSSSSINLNEPLVQQLLKLNERLVQLSNLTPLSVGDLLKFPGTTTVPNMDWLTFEKCLLQQLSETITLFNQCRSREGAELKKHLLTRLEKVEVIVQEILFSQPENIQCCTQRLRAKLETLSGASIEPERINQELAFYIQRIDVDEELSRLKTHIQEAKRLLMENQSQSLGKRLDFMMQELNREANTLASKSNLITLSQAAIEIKVLIEQMREQIQNLE